MLGINFESKTLICFTMFVCYQSMKSAEDQENVIGQKRNGSEQFQGIHDGRFSGYIKTNYTGTLIKSILPQVT